ncbi:MAG: TrgA family protein [Pseudomonadota bacterium]
MPTAARLVAAIVLGALTAVMVFVLIAYYPEEPWERSQTRLVQTFAVVGALVGWFSLGKRAGQESGVGISLGIRAALTTTAWLLFVLSVNHVINRIIDSQLAGARPMQAIWEVVEKAVEYFGFLLHGQIIAIGLGLGIIAGIITARAQKAWR